MRGRQGIGLLEIIAALTILSVAGVTLLVMQAESTRAVQRAHAAEQEVVTASAFLHAVALWTREDLDRHLGDRPQDPWRMYTERVQPELYRVVLSDTVRGSIVLQTELFRRQGNRDIAQ
jgi:type II secretory pathway pseudopilin PulG